MKEKLSLAMDIGEQMLLCGAEVHRVEESITRMCYALGAKRIDVFIITSSMVATFYREDDESYTQTRRILGSSTDFELLHRLNDLCRQVCAQKMTVSEIRAALQETLDHKTYPLWLEVVCYAAIAGAFTLFFGGGWIEAAFSLLVGAAVRFVILFAEKAVSNKIFPKFLSAAAATAMAFCALKLGWIPSVDKVIIGNIMSLIPGIGLTNALRDLFTGDSIAGLLRSVEAVLIALAIAAGYFLVAIIGGFTL